MLSVRAAEHVSNPRNIGPVPGYTHVGVGGVPGDGPYSRLWLRVEDGTIRQAGYECNGCPSSIASSSMVAQIVTGRSLDQALSLTSEDVLLLLDGLPEGKGYYADLAVSALQNAIGLTTD